MKRRLAVLAVIIAVVATGLSLIFFNVDFIPNPASPERQTIDSLLKILFGIASIFFTIVVVIFLDSVLFFRRRKGDNTDGPPIRGYSPLEISWTLIPLIIVIALGIIRGALAGLVGVAAGFGLTELVRRAFGLKGTTEFPFVIGIVTGVTTYLLVAGVFRYWLDWAKGRRVKEEPPAQSWKRYFSVDANHKVIAVQYLVTAMAFLPFAVALQLLGRAHVAKIVPGLLSVNAYESVIGAHGIVMLFIVVLPAISGLVNYVVPLLIGARDMAFPHLNAFSYWLVPPAGLLTVFSLAAGGFDTGWTVYPPLSSDFQSLGMDLILLGVFLSGLSSILSAVNFLTTIFKMRAPGMSFFRMPIFVWAVLATTGLSLVFTQFVAVAFIMVLLERLAGLGFFRPEHHLADNLRTSDNLNSQGKLINGEVTLISMFTKISLMLLQNR